MIGGIAMSIKSQTNNMRRLAALLNINLCNIHGKKECGPNGSKQVFLNVGKVFLRARTGLDTLVVRTVNDGCPLLV